MLDHAQQLAVSITCQQSFCVVVLSESAKDTRLLTDDDIENGEKGLGETE